MIRSALAVLLFATPALAGDLKIENATIPLAPPGTMAHAAFLTLTNEGNATRQLVGVSADGYRMAHIHKSELEGGIATMSAVDLIEIAPGQSVTFEHGGLHIMLMQPRAPMTEGDRVTLTLEFADGSSETAIATVMRRMHGSHGS